MAGIQITLNNNTYSLHESRIVRMINSDNKSDATYMGWWNKIKDFFRSEKNQRCYRHYMIFCTQKTVQLLQKMLLLIYT